MDGIKDFPPEFTKCFVIPFYYLKSCNIEYFDDNNIPFWRKYWRFIIMVVVVICNLSSICIYVFNGIQSKMSITELAFMICVCIIGFQSISKAIILMPKKRDIENLLKGVAKAWKTENLNDFQINEKNRRLKQLNFGKLALVCGATIGIFQNVAVQLIFTVIGKIRHDDYNFILPFGYAYPFDPVKNWGRYLLVYSVQTYSVTRLLNYYIGIHCLIITLCSQLSMLFALLREDIKNAVPMPNKNKLTAEPTVDNKMRIETMVKNHQELIRLAQLLNLIFNRMVFFDLCFYALIMTFFAILTSLSHNALDRFTYIISLMTLMIMVYLFCFYCEMLKEQSEGIAESAYENPWYEGGTHYQKTIRFIIMRAQLPCYVTSLNYAPITLNTFTKVVSTTWSYFSLATTVCGDN